MFCSAWMCCLEEVYKCFAIVICLVLFMCTLNIRSSVLCVLMVECMSVVVNVMVSLMSVISPPLSCLVQPIGSHCCEVMSFGCFGFRGELGFLNCADVCMCVVNKQFELLEFVFDSVYVALQYDEIYLTFTAGSVSLCCVCCHVIVFGLSVSFSWYPKWMRWFAVTVMRVLLFVVHVCLLRECDGVRLTAMLVWGMHEVW